MYMSDSSFRISSHLRRCWLTLAERIHGAFTTGLYRTSEKDLALVLGCIFRFSFLSLSGCCSIIAASHWLLRVTLREYIGCRPLRGFGCCIRASEKNKYCPSSMQLYLRSGASTMPEGGCREANKGGSRRREEHDEGEASVL